VIVGGSEAIGLELAKLLADAGINLVLTGRNADRLDEARTTLAAHATVDVRTLSVDMIAPDGPDQVMAATADLEVGLLAYVAGGGVAALHVVDQSSAQLVQPIKLNPIGQTLLAAHFGKAMRARGRGGIMIVASNAAASGLGMLSVYAAAKAFTICFCEGLWYELKSSGVDVLGLVIGVTRTPSIKRAAGLPIDDPAFPGAWPADIAREALEHMKDGPIWYAAGTGPGFERLRALPRAQAATEAGDVLARLMGH